MPCCSAAVQCASRLSASVKTEAIASAFVGRKLCGKSVPSGLQRAYPCAKDGGRVRSELIPTPHFRGRPRSDRALSRSIRHSHTLPACISQGIAKAVFGNPVYADVTSRLHSSASCCARWPKRSSQKAIRFWILSVQSGKPLQCFALQSSEGDKRHAAPAVSTFGRR